MLAAIARFLRDARVRALFRESAWRRARYQGISSSRFLTGVAVDFGYAAGQQLRCFACPAPPGSFRPGKPGFPVIVPVPGIYERWDCMLPLLRRLNRMGFAVRPVPSLRRMREPVPVLADRLAQELGSWPARDVVLLCHSKGGLVGRLALHRMRDPHRIRLVIALASPFRGSTTALYVEYPPEARTLRPASRDVVRYVDDRLPFDNRVRSLMPRVDQAIFRRGELPGVPEECLPLLIGHHRILSDARTWVRIVRLLRDEFGSPPPPRVMRLAAARHGRFLPGTRHRLRRAWLAAGKRGRAHPPGD